MLEILGEGSIINYQSFLVNDMMSVNIRPIGMCSILELQFSEMEVLMDQFEDLETTFLIFQKHILDSNKRFPVDYMKGGEMNSRRKKA